MEVLFDVRTAEFASWSAFAPLGTLFETLALIFSDAVISALMEAKKEDEDPLKGMQQGKGYADCKRYDAKYIFSTNGTRYAKFNKFTGEQTGPFPFSDFPDQKRLTDCFHRHTGIKLDDPSASMLFQPDNAASCSPASMRRRYSPHS